MVKSSVVSGAVLTGLKLKPQLLNKLFTVLFGECVHHNSQARAAGLPVAHQIKDGRNCSEAT